MLRFIPTVFFRTKFYAFEVFNGVEKKDAATYQAIVLGLLEVILNLFHYCFSGVCGGGGGAYQRNRLEKSESRFGTQINSDK